jgi:hypothetical protein
VPVKVLKRGGREERLDDSTVFETCTEQTRMYSGTEWPSGSGLAMTPDTAVVDSYRLIAL